MDDLNLDDYVIKDDFYKSIVEEITCSICSTIKRNPVMCTKCQNSFCSTCIENWKQKSNTCPFKCNNPEYIFCRIINNLLSKLNFKCKNNCGENIPFDNLNNHYEFDCKNIDFNEKTKKLSFKYNQLEIKYNKIKNAFSSLLNFNLDSKIIEEPEDFVFLKKCFNEFYINYQKERNYTFQLLYRATRDGDNGPNFHERCDNKEGGVLVLYHTDKNIIFGGFSNAKWISYANPEKKAAGKDFTGNINFLFQLNNKRMYKLRVVEKPEKTSAIFCRSDCGPCFGSLGEDIWCKTEFLRRKGKLHKDLAKGRKCSFDTKFDYELNNGEPDFQLKELEAFLLTSY
jgi:hypothetical protein